MSVQLIAWAYGVRVGSATRKAVLLALANAANHYTGLCCPSIERLAEETELGESTVKRVLADLVESGLISRERRRRLDGSLGVYEYEFPEVETRERAYQGSERDLGKVANSEIPRSRSEPSRTRSKPLTTEPEECATPGASLAVVDRKPVTNDERKLSREVLAVWNGLSGQNLSAETWLRKIIGRIREHPELSLADHQRVIAKNLADPWWKGPATPSVVYGNDAQFERSLLASENVSDLATFYERLKAKETTMRRRQRAS